MRIRHIAVAVAAMMVAGPASAQWSAGADCVEVPEPADFALFAMGVAGLLIGRRGSRNRRDQSNQIP